MVTLEVSTHIRSKWIRPEPTLRRKALSASLVALSVLVASCAQDPTSVVGPDPDPSGTETDHGLLKGSTDTPAIEATRKLGPERASREEIDGRFLRTRLNAVLAPAATVGQVNEALETFEARIVTMRERFLVVTLMVPDQPNVADARSLADAIAATPAFAFVSPAFAASLATARVTITGLPPSGDAGLEHWALMRMPAAWNAARLALDAPARVPVLVPDLYYELDPHPEVSSQRFWAGAGAKADSAGNHGFVMSGLIGADYDESSVTGASPAPDTLVDIVSIPLSGLPLFDGLTEIEAVMGEIKAALPTGGRFVLNTSINSKRADAASGELDKGELVDRAIHALTWRFLVGEDYDRFLHVASAGNDGEGSPTTGSDARYAAPWSVASRWDDPRNVVPEGVLTAEERAWLDGVFESTRELWPYTELRTPNVVIVGASDASGERADFSNRHADLRTIGEGVWSTCTVSEPPECDAGVSLTSGTSEATAMVSGIAAYLWNLAPSLTVAELRAHLLAEPVNLATPAGILDAYDLLLCLDSGVDVVNGRVRHTLLDVSGPGPEPDSPPNGVFDEADLTQYMTLFRSYETVREGIAAGDWYADHSRHDLNGNGFTHEFGDGVDLYAESFDLDADGVLTSEVPASIEGQTITFDETALTDMEILCYYAYSNELYAGEGEARRSQLADICANELTVEIDFPSTVIEGTPEELVIRVGRPTPDGTEWIEGAEVEVVVTNGEVTISPAITDEDGHARTFVVPGAPDPTYPAVEVHVTATDDSGGTGEATATAGHALMWQYGHKGSWSTAGTTVEKTGTVLAQGPVDRDSLGLATGELTLESAAEYTATCDTGSRSLEVSNQMIVQQSFDQTAEAITFELDAHGVADGTRTDSPDAGGCMTLWSRPTGSHVVRFLLRPAQDVAYTVSMEYTATDLEGGGRMALNNVERSFGSAYPLNASETVSGTWEANEWRELSIVFTYNPAQRGVDWGEDFRFKVNVELTRID